MMKTALLLALVISWQHTPNWVKEFRRQASVIRYQRSQPNLRVALKMKKGNCQTYAALCAKLALLAGEIPCLVTLDDKKTNEAHRVCFVRIGKVLWVASDKYVRPFSNQKDAILWIGKQTNNHWVIRARYWPQGTDDLNWRG